MLQNLAYCASVSLQILKMKRLKFLFHLFVLTYFLPSFDCNMNVEKALSSKKKESDLLEELKVWVDDIIQG